MYSEIGFIFDDLMGTFNNINNTGSIYQRVVKIKRKAATSIDKDFAGGAYTAEGAKNVSGTSNAYDPSQQKSTEDPKIEDAVLRYKGHDGDQIINVIKQYVYAADESNQDPYISLINYFNGKSNKSLWLRAGDFAYLKDLGVYPINRLWILRRFPDNTIVPNNLLAWGNQSVEPISTVIGWLKYKEDSDLFSVNFGENWVEQNQMLDKVINEMMKSEFGFKTEMLVPIPGWSQGILFGILNGMGLSSDYDATNVPTGDPNVLRTSKIRDIGSESLVSKLGITLETSYEQKYINGVDPGMAMLDVMGNLYKMGTSDHKFVLGNSSALQKLISNIQENKGAEGWINLAKTLVAGFIKGIKNFIDVVKDSPAAKVDTPKDPPKESPKDAPKAPASAFTAVDKEGLKSSLNGVSVALDNIGNILLAGTISKYRWPLKGSIALMSGINTTPWHLTVGNPFSPILNIGNILVSDVSLKFSNDFGFNDMPASINVTISADMSRPMGRSELERMFNNGYKRVYANGEKPNSIENVGISTNKQVSKSDEIGASNNLKTTTNPSKSKTDPNSSVPIANPPSATPDGTTPGPGNKNFPTGTSYKEMAVTLGLVSSTKATFMSPNDIINMLKDYDKKNGSGNWKA